MTKLLYFEHYNRSHINFYQFNFRKKRILPRFIITLNCKIGLCSFIYNFMISTVDFSLVNELSVKAGKAILEVYYNELYKENIDYKSDNSPLTIADKISHKIISEGLQSINGSIPIISEEGIDIPFDSRSGWDYFWLVDPLDGTKEFIKRNGEFTVNISLIEKNRPIAGFIYVPVQDLLYFNFPHQSAKKLEGGQEKNIRVSSKTSALTAISSRSHGSLSENNHLIRFPIERSVTAGSSLKFCYVAEGLADIYYREGPTMEWDTAAGQSILEAAGGRMTTLEHKAFIYNKNSLLNPGFICNGSGITI